MRFFRKLFGLVSNSEQKDDYARATYVYATSPWINKSNAKVHSNRVLTFEGNCAYHRAISDYARAFEINTKNATSVIDVGMLGLQGQRTSLTFFRSFTSTAYRLTATQKPS
ncbi:MAG: hypothetical protein GY774_40315 [Planctomycetes bacterium]|nr:hypothetical protein [Planctomycetota bacterium]